MQIERKREALKNKISREHRDIEIVVVIEQQEPYELSLSNDKEKNEKPRCEPLQQQVIRAN